MPDHSVSVNNVSVWYGRKGARTCALNDVTITFNPGELTLVMGPSGSGKTTLLSLLGCLRSPDAGSVRIEDCDVSALKEHDRRRIRCQIGFVFQAFRLFHSLPAIENVMIAAEISTGRQNKMPAARALLEQLGLGEKLHLRPDELSGGEKQRVAIARALLSDPPIVLADEPTASLDFQAGKQISEILMKLAAEQQRTVVVVSHDHRWLAYADRIIMLENGRVAEDRKGHPCILELEPRPAHS